MISDRKTSGVFVKTPVLVQDTYSVEEIAILFRVSRNSVYEWHKREDDPPAFEAHERQEARVLRLSRRAPRVEQTARDVIVVRQNLSGRPASIRVEIVPAQIN